MLKLGIIAGAAAFGVSFLLGLVSSTPVLIVLLRAGVFAALFFGLGVGITHLALNILDISSAEDLTGQKIDISVGDGGAFAGGKKGAFGAEFTMPDSAFGERPPARDTSAFLNENEDTLDDISALFLQDGEAAPNKAASNRAARSGGERFEDDLPLGGLDNGEEAIEGGGGLVQNADYDYHTVGSIAIPADAQSSAQPVRNEEVSSNLFSGFDSFVPGIPGVEGAYTTQAEEPDGSDSSLGGRSMTVGTVEMSLQKAKPEPDFGNVDGKKMAGAIQTILKKDKE